MVTIREASPADGPLVAAVFLASRRAFLGYLPELHPDAETEAWLTGRLAEGRGWIAEEDGHTAGFLILERETVESLYLAPGSTGRGTGAALLALAKAASPDRLELHLFTRNDGARRFYERHGFVVVERGDGSGNEEGEPDLKMVWRA